MKKLYILLIAVMLLVVVSGCGKSAEKEKTTSTTAVDNSNTNKEVKTNITFKDGVLSTDDYELTIKKSEVIQSPSENNPGLFVTFELKNKTDTDLDPSLAIDSLIATQENENTRSQLESNYSYLDAFGGENDVDKYNEMVDLANKQGDAVLSEKTAEKVEAYVLDNKNNHVIFEAIDSSTGKSIGNYEVKLK